MPFNHEELDYLDMLGNKIINSIESAFSRIESTFESTFTAKADSLEKIFKGERAQVGNECQSSLLLSVQEKKVNSDTVLSSLEKSSALESGVPALTTSRPETKARTGLVFLKKIGKRISRRKSRRMARLRKGQRSRKGIQADCSLSKRSPDSILLASFTQGVRFRILKRMYEKKRKKIALPLFDWIHADGLVIFKKLIFAEEKKVEKFSLSSSLIPTLKKIALENLLETRG